MQCVGGMAAAADVPLDTNQSGNESLFDKTLTVVAHLAHGVYHGVVMLEVLDGLLTSVAKIGNLYAKQE